MSGGPECWQQVPARIGVPDESRTAQRVWRSWPGWFKLGEHDPDVLVQKRTGACALTCEEQFLDDGVVAAGRITRGRQFVQGDADAAAPEGRWSR